MGALSTLIWFVALVFGGIAIVFVVVLVARNKYLSSGQEEGE